MVRAAVVIVGSCLIELLSRRSLMHPRSHGFWRFFAFELLLVLVVLNAPAWFRDPLAPRQGVSWLLLVGSAGLAIHAFRLFHTVGRSAGGASIVAFPSAAFYGGRLEPSADAAARRFEPVPGGRFDAVFDPEHPAVLVLLAHEGFRTRSEPEADLVARMVVDLMAR